MDRENDEYLCMSSGSEFQIKGAATMQNILKIHWIKMNSADYYVIFQGGKVNICLPIKWENVQGKKLNYYI